MATQQTNTVAAAAPVSAAPVSATSATAATSATDATAAISAPVVEAEEPSFKVFVGNMSFKTTEESLTEFFKTCGTVLDATIITRGTRSLGYGFVTYASQAEVDKASKELNKKELEGREINVETAHPKTVRVGEPRPRRHRKRNSKKKVHALSRRRTTAEESEDEAQVEVAQKPVPSSTLSDTEAGEDEGEEATPRKSRAGRRTRKNKTREGRKPKPRAPVEDSKTRLFVANLPFATTDEELMALFKGYNIKSAAVARIKSGRSKGYGFVETESEEEQQKTLAKFQEITLDGRVVSLKIARVEQSRKTKETATEGEETQPVDATPVETQPADTTPVETKPVEGKEETKAIETKKEEAKEAPKASK
ncbi:hypothetical protein BDF14DRAFT_346745 [Spinellus fusiger]|nr:hypothetical protein BDF14DRAFT_346745 [Spinellus fusiger]